MRNLKRLIAMVLTVAMVMSALPAEALAAEQRAAGDVSRVDWLCDLIDLFGMTVEEDNYPDNYFSDIDATYEKYYEIMVATEFGLIDTEPGEAMEPEAPVTREFAAFTLNNCLGFQLEDETYTFSDVEEVAYPTDAQVAVNRGWLTLQGGAFLPSQNITTQEAAAMLADAEAVLGKTEASVTQTGFRFADFVKNIEEEVDFSESEDGVVTIQDCPQTIAAGDTFVLWFDGMPTVYYAEAVNVQGTETYVRTGDFNYQEAVLEYGYEDSTELDLQEFEEAEGVETVYVETAEEAAAELANLRARGVETRGLTVKGKSLIGTVTFDLKDGYKFTLGFTLSNLKVDKKGHGDYAMMALSGDLELAANASVAADKSLVIGQASYGPFTLTLSLDVAFDGSVNLSYTGYLKVGVEYDGGDWRLLREFRKKAFTVSVDADSRVGTTLRLSGKVFILSASAFAKCGIRGTLNSTHYNDGSSPNHCVTIKAWLYASIGANASVNLGIHKESKSWNYEIYGLRNSPIKVYYHYEDDLQVNECTKGQAAGNAYTGYVTGGNSVYGSSCYGSSSSTGTTAGGETYQIYSYTLNNKNEATITDYHGLATALTIPKKIDGYTVVAIGDDAFKWCRSLRTVVVSEGIVTIGSGAFSGCSNLCTVSLPKTLTDMGAWAFTNCTSLRSVNIPKSLKGTGPWPFSGCENLSHIEFEDGVTKILDNCFNGVTGLTELVIPDTVTSIGAGAFGGCSNLKSVEIPNSVTTIGKQAFGNCSSLEELVLPDSVKSLGESAFENNTSLHTVVLSKKLEDIGTWTFRGCTALTSVDIPKSLKTSWEPFTGCSALKEVTFEAGTTTVIGGLLGVCTGLESITLPNTITSIGDHAFKGCTNLTELVIPNSVRTIGDSAISSCTSLKELDLPNSVVSLGDGVFAYSTLESMVLPDSVITVGDTAFQNCTELKNITLSKKMTGLGAWAFSGCTALEAIEIPKSLTGAHSVFTGCSALKTVTFEEGTTAVIDQIFNGCPGLEEITLPDTIVKVGSYAFHSCSSLKKVTLSANLKEIGDSAFSYSPLLEEISIPDTVTSMGEEVFRECSSLTAAKLPKDLTYIPRAVFQGCSSLESAILPEAATVINNNAFDGCNALKELDLGDQVKTIGNTVFKNCDALTSIVIPDSVTSMEHDNFMSCDSLKEVKLGTGLTTIPRYTFFECGSLESIVVPYRVTKIETNAFANSVALKEITIPRNTVEINQDAFSYPANLTIYGISGTYAEEYAGIIGATFVNREIAATAVTLSSSELNLTRGQRLTLAMNVTPENFTDEVSWKSTDTNIITVSDTGEIYAKADGTATLKLTVGNVSATCKVTVVQPVENIFLNKNNVSLEGLQTVQLTAEVHPDNAFNKDVVWASSDESVAAVTQSGLVTALKKGTAKISVTAQDGSGKMAECTVTVTNTVVVANHYTELESAHNYANNSNDIWVYTLAGAKSLAVAFDEQTNIEDGFDYLYIYDKNGQEIGKYTGTSLAGETISVSGDTVRIKLVSDDSGNEWGFKVVNVVDNSACADGHNYVNGICSNCGAKEPKVEFVDVTAADYFYSAVNWAVENNVTKGLTEDTFAPYKACSRADIVTFLYRALEGTPSDITCNFKDVSVGEYYYEPMMWAVENGITTGITADRFGPYELCTREQIVTFLWRALGSEMTANTISFVDVTPGEWFYDAVRWAVASGVTTGQTPTTFGAFKSCCRADSVLFIQRAVEE